MLSEIESARSSHLMEVNTHKVPPENIGAVQQEDLVVATHAIAVGEGWSQLSSDSPVIYLRQLNVVLSSQHCCGRKFHSFLRADWHSPVIGGSG